jgi:hypothetical protein
LTHSKARPLLRAAHAIRASLLAMGRMAVYSAAGFSRISGAFPASRPERPGPRHGLGVWPSNKQQICKWFL